MKLTVDQYDTGASPDAMFQVRSHDCGIETSPVGCIGEMICDITVSQKNAVLAGTVLKALENCEIALKPRE